MKERVNFFMLLVGCFILSFILRYISSSFVAEPQNEGFPSDICFPSVIDKIILDGVSKLPDGRILCNIPTNMKVGQTESVDVRIEKSITEDFTKNLEGSGAIEIENIKVADVMGVELKYDDQKFLVNEISVPEQMVMSDSYTWWVWDITPLKSGEGHLFVVATFKLVIPGQEDQYKVVTLSKKRITTEINPVYSVKKFINDHWEWLIGTIFIPVVGFVAFKRSKRKRKRKEKKLRDFFYFSGYGNHKKREADFPASLILLVESHNYKLIPYAFRKTDGYNTILYCFQRNLFDHDIRFSEHHGCHFPCRSHFVQKVCKIIKKVLNN